MRPKVAPLESVIQGVHPIGVRNKRTNISFARKKIVVPKELSFQFFLASVCDAELAANTYWLGLRYSDSPDVKRLLQQIHKSKISSEDIASSHPNVLLSVLRELLTSFASVFPSEELICVTQIISEDLLQLYTRGQLIEQLDIECREMLCCVCKALQKLIRYSKNINQALTDVIMIFSPIFFPSCNTAKSFVRAARVTILMINDHNNIFQSLDIDYYPESQLEIAEYDEIYDSGMDLNFDAETDQTYSEIRLPEVAPYYIISFED